MGLILRSDIWKIMLILYLTASLRFHKLCDYRQGSTVRLGPSSYCFPLRTCTDRLFDPWSTGRGSLMIWELIKGDSNVILILFQAWNLKSKLNALTFTDLISGWIELQRCSVLDENYAELMLTIYYFKITNCKIVSFIRS